MNDNKEFFVPTFKIAINPQIRLSEIKARHFFKYEYKFPSIEIVEYKFISNNIEISNEIKTSDQYPPNEPTDEPLEFIPWYQK